MYLVLPSAFHARGHAGVGAECVRWIRERGREREMESPSPHTRAPVSPSLADQPRRLRPNRHHMPAEEGRGEAWKLAEGSFTVATLAFFSTWISITQTAACDLNLLCKPVRFVVFFRRGKIGRIFFTTEVIRFHFGVTVAFEWSKRYETNRFSFPSHFPPIYIQSVLAGYGDSQSNTGFGQGLLNFLRYVLSVWVI